MSAGYDGKTIVWDVSIQFSRVLRRSANFVNFTWWIYIFCSSDLGRHPNQDIWNFPFQVGRRQVFTVSDWNSIMPIALMLLILFFSLMVPLSWYFYILGFLHCPWELRFHSCKVLLAIVGYVNHMIYLALLALVIRTVVLTL